VLCLSLLVFTQLFSEVARSEAAKPAQKQNLTRNSQSRSFTVIHFGITEKPTRDCISQYNNTGFISKVSEKIASENAENCRCRQPHCRMTPHPRRTSANIRINLTPPETRVIGHTFLPLIVWVCLHSNFCGGLRKTHLFCNRVRIGRSRSSNVFDFGTNRKGVCDFLLVINSNFGPVLHRFWDTATYWLKICEFFLPHSHLTPSLGVNPFEFAGWIFYPEN